MARSAYFLAFLSPKFLNSEECRRELERFLEIEEAAGHRDLILPIYFIETPEWADPDSAESSEIAGLVRTLKTRQTPDFCQLRSKPAGDPEVATKISRLAGQLATRLRRDRKPHGGSRPPPARSTYPLPDFVPVSFLGREELIEELKAALAEPRTVLLALVGKRTSRSMTGTTSRCCW